MIARELTIEEARDFARHWAARTRSGGPIELTDYEREALLGWVRREMARRVDKLYEAAFFDVEARLSHGECEAAALDREALAHHIMTKLGWETLGSDHHGEHGLAWTLCEAAGWPT